MSRPLRIEFDGALYHVTSRGDRREPIVEDDVDRVEWQVVLGEVCGRYGWRIHAWCLMTNHYHLLVETPNGGLSAGMRDLNGVWSQRFNRRHGRVGHVFQGRFKAVLVDRESYLLELCRYVVLNPVRAGMTGDAAGYPWSSYAATVARSDLHPHVDAPPWLETDVLLKQFASTRRRAVMGYVDFVRAGVGLPSIWLDLQGQVFLGSEAFIERMQALIAQQDRPLREVPHAQRKPLDAICRPALARLAQRNLGAAKTQRNIAMAQAYLKGDLSMQAVADAFGVHVATLSRAVRQYKGASPCNDTSS